MFNKGWLVSLVLLAATASVLLLAGCGDTAAESADTADETAEYYDADDEAPSDDTASSISESTVESAASTDTSAPSASSVSESAAAVADDQAAAGTNAGSIGAGTTDQTQASRPAQASSTAQNYAYQPVPQTGQQETVYINTAIPGRYHKDPNCRGLQRYGGGTAMTLAQAQAQAQGYSAFCAYERYGDN